MGALNRAISHFWVTNGSMAGPRIFRKCCFVAVAGWRGPRLTLPTGHLGVTVGAATGSATSNCRVPSLNTSALTAVAAVLRRGSAVIPLVEPLQQLDQPLQGTHPPGTRALGVGAKRGIRISRRVRAAGCSGDGLGHSGPPGVFQRPVARVSARGAGLLTVRGRLNPIGDYTTGQPLPSANCQIFCPMRGS